MNSRKAEIQHERDFASKVAEVKIKQAEEKRLTEVSVAQCNMQTKIAECEAVTKQKEADANARAKESESQARIVESNNSVKESADQEKIATARATEQYYKTIERVIDLLANCNSKDTTEQLMGILQKLSDPRHLIQKRNQRKPVFRPRQSFNPDQQGFNRYK